MLLKDSPTSPDFLALPKDEQEFLLKVAGRLKDMLADTEKAMANEVSSHRLENEELLALWGLLPSGVRSAIKRGGAQ